MPQTQTKTMTVEKMDGEGHGLARIATLSAVDHDGDTYTPGAFAWKEQWVPILPAHNRRSLPLGKARLYEDGDAALAELHMNLGTSAGADWHKALKFDLENGKAVQEWSYGFGVLDHETETRDGERVNVLKKLDVHEISPVVRGAGQGTATLSMKSRGSFADHLDALIAELDDALGRADEVKALRAADGRGMSKARLDQLVGLRERLDALITAPVTEDGAKALAAEAERLAANFLTRAARRRVR